MLMGYPLNGDIITQRKHFWKLTSISYPDVDQKQKNNPC